MGKVEVDLIDLVERSHRHAGMMRRTDPLAANRQGLKTSGTLAWSVQFCPMWQIPEDELEKKIAVPPPVGEPSAYRLPWWIDWIHDYMDVPDWEKERARRRRDTLEWFSGERERQKLEAMEAPSAERRSGVLQFHVHQCIGEFLYP